MADENVLMSKKQYDIFMKRINACNDHIESDTEKDKARQDSVRKEESSPTTHHNQDGREDGGSIKNKKMLHYQILMRNCIHRICLIISLLQQKGWGEMRAFPPV